MTTSIDQLDQNDAVATEITTAPVPGTQFTTIVLALRDRTVSFTGRQVSSIPDPTWRTDATGRPLEEQAVYLTGKGKVAIHDPRRRTLAVHDLDAFIDQFTDTPVSWIVDDVLSALPQPLEHLDI